MKYLNLSDDVAAMFVRVARKSLQVPELGHAVQAVLQITKAKTIASVISKTNKGTWIEKAQTLSKEKLEREVANANSSAPKPEKAKSTGSNRMRIEFEVIFKEAEILKRARELLSQKQSKHAHIGETFMTALANWVEREDPVRKAERAEVRKTQKRDSIEKQSKESENDKTLHGSETHHPCESSHRQSRDRFQIPAAIRHQVYLRDRGGCRKRMPDGSNCGCKKWTDIHHIIPKAHGGADTLENLITLCKAHHRQLHRESVLH